MSQPVRGIRHQVAWTTVGSLVAGGGLFGGAVSAQEGPSRNSGAVQGPVGLS